MRAALIAHAVKAKRWSMLCIAAVSVTQLIVPERAGAQTRLYKDGGSIPGGSHGIHRVHSARRFDNGHFVLSLSGSYAQTGNFLVSGDVNTYEQQHASFLFAPAAGFELALALETAININSAFNTQGTILWQPAFLLKYSAPLSSVFHLGAYVTATLPQSVTNSGLSFVQGAFSGVVVATVNAQDWLDLSVNLGYSIDRRGPLYDDTLDASQRQALGFATTNGVIVGAGAATAVAVGSPLWLAPFVEVTSILSVGPAGNGGGAVATVPNSPTRLTLGSKLFLSQLPTLDLGLGVDIRLAAATASPGLFAAVPPWLVFAQLNVHLDWSDAPDNAASLPTPPCAMLGPSIDAGGHSGVMHGPVFTVTGEVLSFDSGTAIPSATVLVSDYDSTFFTTEPQTGRFKIPPMHAGDGTVVIKVSALGYLDAQQAVRRGNPNEQVRLRFRLQEDQAFASSQLHGIISQAGSGTPVRAKISVTDTGQDFLCDETGVFHGNVRPGRHAVVVTADSYSAQKRDITVHNGEVFVLDVHLQQTDTHIQPAGKKTRRQ